MNLNDLKGHSGGVLAAALIALALVALALGEEGTVPLLIIGIIGGCALQVLLLAIVADATVQTLKKQKKRKK